MITNQLTRRCQRCRRRKIKCNGQIPCSRCVAGGHSCVPPDVFLVSGSLPGERRRRRRFADSTTEAEESATEAEGLPIQPATRTAQAEEQSRFIYAFLETKLNWIPLAPQITLEERAIAHHFSAISTFSLPMLRLLCPFQAIFAIHYNNAPLHSPLRLATQAQALLSFSKQDRNPDCHRRALETYGRAMAAIQPYLNPLPSRLEQVREVVLTVWGLAIFEASQVSEGNTQRHRAHLDGVNQVIEVAESALFADEDSREILLGVHQQLIFDYSLRSRAFHRPSLTADESAMMQHFRCSSNNLFPIHIHIPGLRARAAALHGSRRSDAHSLAKRLVSDLVALDQRFKDWMTNLPQDYRAVTRIDRSIADGRPSSQYWPTFALITTKPEAAILHNLARMGRIFVLDAIRTCLPFLTPDWPRMNPEYVHFTHETSRALSELNCATLFSLFNGSVVDPEGDRGELPSPNVTFNPTDWMVPPILAALHFGCLEQPRRDWILSFLRRVSGLYLITYEGLVGNMDIAVLTATARSGDET